MQAVGIARASYEYALEYAKERVQFGRPIIQNQSIAFMLADMITEIDASRMLCYRAAWLAKNGEFQNAEGSMAKLKAGRTATWVTERAIQILGGDTATSANTRSNAGTATRRSTTSSKAPSKSNSSSSAEQSPECGFNNFSTLPVNTAKF